MNDSEDPHDLAFSPTHFPRASMVDNLVMSLDQFSTEASKTREYDQATIRSYGQPGLSPVTTSDSDRHAVIATTHGTRPSHPDTDKHRGTQESHGRSSRQEVDVQNPKHSVPQRTTVKLVSSRSQQPDVRQGGRSRSGSNSSSVDLGHLVTYVGRLGPAGNRRSQSFDFGSRRPQRSIMDAIDTSSPAPVIATATDPYKAPMSPMTPVRKNSGRSAKSAPRQKQRSGTVGANTLKPKSESPQPMPVSRAFLQDDRDRKLPPTPMSTEPTNVPRPGFFRRVFGSSKNTSASPTSGYATPPPRASQDRVAIENQRPTTPQNKSHKQTTKPPDTVTTKEAEHVVTKKPSSFFRRRKKSVSGGVPPPLPLTLANGISSDKTIPDAPSPVSSLKAIMDPYLGDKIEGQNKHTRGSSLQSVQNADSTAPETSSVKRNNGKSRDHISEQPIGKHARQASSKSLSRLHIPHSGILADTVNLPDRKEEKSLSNSGSPRAKSTDKPVPALPNFGQRKSSMPGFEASRPGIPPRSDSSNMDLGPHLRQVNTSESLTKAPPSAGASDTSIYKSAPSTPIDKDAPSRLATRSPHVHVSHPSMSLPTSDDTERARKLLENPEEDVGSGTACSWLGDAGTDRERVRKAYMGLFDWSSKNILAALRSLCSKLALKGESQQVDRVLDAFAKRWCECNTNHGFKSADVVHTICYSLLLLNTDLHLADIGQKMTRAQFIKNAMSTIRQVASDTEVISTPQSANFLAVRSSSYTGSSPPLQPSAEASSRSQSALASRMSDRPNKDDELGVIEATTVASEPLVEAPYTGSQGGWEIQVESVLKDFYASISREPLPLFGQPNRALVPPNNNSLLGLSGLRRTPSVLSKAQSETRSRTGLESKSLGSRWPGKGRSRPRLGTSYGFGSSRTSVDDGSSNWSPLSSTWSRVSLNKTLTSMSVDSFGTEHHGDYQSSIGFANALSQAIIRDEQMETQTDDGLKAAPLLEDESLELHGAPWAKEGILKHKCHLEGTDKRSKDRNWNDCFAVIEKGWMRLFSFSMTAKSLRTKARNQKATGVVGGGNWQDNAEEVWKFMLRHTIASSLPPPGYSKQRPFVWALSLPNGAVHLFSVGTPDIVKEFVSTANFWSARLSKEPMTSGVSSMEYGWSDSVINRSLISSESQPVMSASPRPSTQLSLRSSIDHGGSVRPRLPGDRAHISEWNPPQQSLTASQLMEVDQLKALQAYVTNVEEELQKHNELRGPMLLAFSSRHPNSARAMTNWEKKSSYLLREIVKFGTYIETLQNTQKAKEKVYKMREQDEAANPGTAD